MFIYTKKYKKNVAKSGVIWYNCLNKRLFKCSAFIVGIMLRTGVFKSEVYYFKEDF